MFPTPNTTFFRDAARCGHFWHAIARCRSSANAAAFASGLNADMETGATASPGNTKDIGAAGAGAGAGFGAGLAGAAGAIGWRTGFTAAGRGALFKAARLSG